LELSSIASTIWIRDPMAAAEATSDLTAAEHREQALAARARAKTLLVALAHLGAGPYYDPSHKITDRLQTRAKTDRNYPAIRGRSAVLAQANEGAMAA
jgi:hypothetical protein